MQKKNLFLGIGSFYYKIYKLENYFPFYIPNL